MNGAAALSARLSLIPPELRVSTIKRVAADLYQESDKGGWPGQRLLEALMEHELAERETRRIDRHRAEANLRPTGDYPTSVSRRFPASPGRR